MTPAGVALLAAAAFAAGVVDAIAGGGGLVTLPALLAAGLRPEIALGTNKGQAFFGAMSSATSYWLHRRVDRGRAPLAFAAGLSGSCAGAAALLVMPKEPLRPIVIGLLVFAAVFVVLRRNTTPVARELAWPRLALVAIALGIGAYDGFFGPGTGTLLIVAFTGVFGDPLTRASANAKVVNLASNLAAVAIFAYGGTIVWEVALPMGAANLAGAAVGARLAVTRGDRFVRWVLLAVVGAVVTKLVVDLVT